MTTKWQDEVCSFCGEGARAYISIRIDMPDPDVPAELAYTQVEMCKECFLEMGMEPAFAHNRQIRDVAGIEQEAKL